MRRVVVIGAGAAGTMAAIFAASRGAETRLLERTRDGGRKILISGGGRCNVLPLEVDETRFVTDSSRHALRRMLRGWPLQEQVAFFEREVGVPLAAERSSGKLFPASNRARDVRDRLLALAVRHAVTLSMRATVTGFAPSSRGWRIDVAGSTPIEADALVVATGGLSVPKTGSDGLGLAALERLGHDVVPPYAALTPLTANPHPFKALAGVSLPVTVTATDDRRSAISTGGFLFTHRGYSGPAVLDVSHVAVRSRVEGGSPARISVQWTTRSEIEWDATLRTRTTRSVAGAVRSKLPERLTLALLDAAGVDPSRRLADLRREERRRVVDALARCELPWTGDEGYEKAEVTGGGVALSEVDPRTMESRRHRGLFLCGELLDAFGPIGGYNFFWAWATGRAAGLGGAGA